MQLVSLWDQGGEIMKLCHTWICCRKKWWTENSECVAALDFVLNCPNGKYYILHSSRENETNVSWASSQSEKAVELHLLSFIGWDKSSIMHASKRAACVFQEALLDSIRQILQITCILQTRKLSVSSIMEKRHCKTKPKTPLDIENPAIISA